MLKRLSLKIRDDFQREIDACPEHGRSHLTWFSLGSKRQGIFYAQTDDYGKTVSAPMALGRLAFLPSHPDVIVPC